MPRKKKIDDSVILQLILEVIIEVGAASFSLSDLSRKTGLSPATLLQRFGSKKNILHKAIALANDNLNRELTNRKQTDKSYVQTIIDIYLELAGNFITPSDIANGLDVLKYDINDKNLNALTRKYFKIRRNKIASLLILATEHNELPQDTDITSMVYNLEALWQGSVMLWALIGKGTLQRWLTARFRTFFSNQYRQIN
jgi:AcrR family transcriptional regulator